MKKIPLITLLLFFNYVSYPQQYKLDKADKEYDKFAYVDAIKTYESVFYSGYKSEDMLQKLANSYYFKADLTNAAKWYNELFKFAKNLGPEYYYRFGQSLKGIEDYKRADVILNKFNEKSGNELRAKLLQAQKDYLKVIEKNSGRYILQNGDINSEQSDYGSSFYKNQIVFASARNSAVLGNIKHGWTGESFTDLYACYVTQNGTLSPPVEFGNKLNSIYNESTPVFTFDGLTVYFTRNNFNKGFKGKDKNNKTLLKIYKATLDGKQWKNISELPFNSNEFSVAHPTLSPDERTLYFASNMPGTYGDSDIFKVSVHADGTYGIPENLGNIINTEGRESFPFVSEDNELYFASDGHPGLGGLDLFVTKVEKHNNFDDIINLGEPINSSKDDFGFLIDTRQGIGFISSNRDGGKGSDDIYGFKEIVKIKYPCEQSLTGIIIDKFTGVILSDTKVILSDSNFNILKEIVSDLTGKFQFNDIDCSSRYYIKLEKEYYGTYEKPIISGQENRDELQQIMMEKEIQAVQVGDDLAKVFNINKIYFAFDKYDIRSDVELDLAIIINVMQQYPTMKIDVRSHTDSRQSFSYNEKLSGKRAKSTIKWLVDRGIAPSRLTGTGYGETQLTNNCKDGVDCTEGEHRFNRRSEFIITSL